MMNVGDSDKYWHHLHVRLAHDDYEHLVAEAEEACETIATVLRRLVRADRLNKEKPALRHSRAS